MDRSKAQVPNLLELWMEGIRRPWRMAARLSDAPAPGLGMAAVLTRFVLTSLTSVLSLHLLGRMPFAPSELVLLPTERYYFAEVFFLPVWGLAIWVLMGSFVHLVLSFSKTDHSYDRILNIIGMGMLVPMPVLWLWDWSAIALNIYTVTNQALTHSVAQLWETGIQAVCFIRTLNLRPAAAVALAILINALYVGLAMHFIR